MLSWHLWGTLLCVLWFYFLWSRRRYYRLMFQLPGPIGYPLIGMAHEITCKEDLLPVFKKYKEKHGSCVFSWLGPIPFLVVSDPQLIQDILTSPHCITKASMYKSVDEAVGRGLFSVKEPLWTEHRRLANPAFAHKMLLNFVPTFNAETAELIQTVGNLVDCDEHNMLPVLMNLTLNIGTQTTMGSEVKYNEYIKSNKLLEAFHCLMTAITDMAVSPWLLSKTVRRLVGREEDIAKAKSQISEFMGKLIESKIANHSEAPEDKNIYLNLAIDLMKRGIFTRKDVEGQAVHVVFAGFETTANAVNNTLILLAMFPEYQQKAFEEICTFFPNTGDFEVTYADTQDMTYLELIVNESMRVLAPGPIIARQATEDVLLSNGVLIPKGVQIAIDIFQCHRDKKNWGEDAETFNPEHFLPHNMQDRHPYSHLPFSKGTRNCIGWMYAYISVKVTLAKLLRNYKFSTSFKFEELEFIEDVSLKFKRPPLLKIERRDR